MAVSSRRTFTKTKQSVRKESLGTGRGTFCPSVRPLVPTELSSWEHFTLSEINKVARVLRRIAKRFSASSVSDFMFDTGGDNALESFPFYANRRFEKHPEDFFKPPAQPATVSFSSPHMLSRGEVLDLSFPSKFEPSYLPFAADLEKFPENKQVFARMWRHPQGQSLGTVIAIHGWLMGDSRLSAVTLIPGYFFRLGLDVIVYELPYHGRRRPASQSEASFFPSSHLARTNEGFAQAIHELRSLVQWLRLENENPVGVLGLSLGAYIGALWSSLDQLSFAICIAPLVSIAEIAWEVLDQRSDSLDCIIPDGLDGISLKDLRNVFAVHCPLNYQPKVEQERRMILAALGDDLVPSSHPRRLWRHWDKPRMHWVGGKHVCQAVKVDSLEYVHDFLLSLGLAHRDPLDIRGEE